MPSRVESQGPTTFSIRDERLILDISLCVYILSAFIGSIFICLSYQRLRKTVQRAMVLARRYLVWLLIESEAAGPGPVAFKATTCVVVRVTLLILGKAVGVALGASLTTVGAMVGAMEASYDDEDDLLLEFLLELLLDFLDLLFILEDDLLDLEEDDSWLAESLLSDDDDDAELLFEALEALGLLVFLPLRFRVAKCFVSW